MKAREEHDNPTKNLRADEARASDVLLAALDDALHARPCAHIDASCAQEVVALARKHRVLPLLYDAFSASNKSEGGLSRAVKQEAQANAHRFWRLLLLSHTCADALERNGIGCVVLKGVSAAAPWPVPEQRKAGDIDLLPLDQERFADAAQIIEDLGFVRDAKQIANHQVVYHNADGVELELHRALIEDFDSEAVNARYRAEQQSLADHVVARRVLGVSFPMLDLPHQAFHLLSHMTQDLLRHGFGLRLLCDWVVLWEQDGSDEAAAPYLQLVDAVGLADFSRAITALCVERLGLSSPASTRLAVGADSGLCAALLDEILAAGEFGYSSVDRIAMPRNAGIMGLAREFHHQTKLNYPRASKAVVTWPVLWTATLVRFLHNNRTVRKTSLSNVIGTARERAKLHENLAIFDRKKSGAPTVGQAPLDVEVQLKEGSTLLISPQGTSMWPTLIAGKDQVEIAPTPARLEAGDIVLYRRPLGSAWGMGGKLVLHRIARVDGDGLWLCGDNQFELEGPLARDCVLGIMTARLRNGKRRAAKSLSWKAQSVALKAASPARKGLRALRRLGREHRHST